MAEEATDRTIRSGQLDGFYIHIEAKGSIGNNKQAQTFKITETTQAGSN